MVEFYYNNDYQVIASRKGIKNWSVNLPDKHDYKGHNTEIKIEALPIGTYALIVSEDANFDSKKYYATAFLRVSNLANVQMTEQNKDGTGIVTGLAWTEVGGELLTIESVIMPGKGRMEITGKLGEVMQESVKAAKSFVRSRCIEYGIIPPVFEKKDIHIHVPEGATPKDGPSAGIAMVTSIVSSLTGIPVKRDVAMTGEVTLRGRVLPIGGLKEKLLAALRGGIKTVLIPDENEKDLAEIPKNVIEGLKIIPVKTVDEVLKVALTKTLTPVDWVEIDISQTQKGKEIVNERPVN